MKSSVRSFVQCIGGSLRLLRRNRSYEITANSIRVDAGEASWVSTGTLRFLRHGYLPAEFDED